MMPTYSVDVQAVCQNGLTKITLEGLGALNQVSELGRQVSVKLSKANQEHTHRDGCNGTLQMTCMRDHRGVRLSQHAWINCRRKPTLFGEVSDCLCDELDERLTDKQPLVKTEPIRNGTTAKDFQTMDLNTSPEASRTDGKKTAQSPSPSKPKRRKTEGEEAKSQTDACRTAEVQPKQKLGSLSLLDSEERQGPRCAACGRRGSPPPSIRLELTHGGCSTQSPSSINLRLQERLCAACSGTDGGRSASSEPGRCSQSPRSDPEKSSKKVKLKKTGTPSGSSLADISDQAVTSSQTAVAEDGTKSSNQASAVPCRKPDNHATGKGRSPDEITKKVHDSRRKCSPSPTTKANQHNKEHSDKREAAKEPSDKISDRLTGGQTRKSELATSQCSANSEHAHQKITTCTAPALTEISASTETLPKVESKYFSAAFDKNSAATVNGNHSEPKGERAKGRSTPHSVGKDGGLTDVDRKPSGTPVVTVDSTSLTSALGGKSRRRKTPEQAGGPQPGLREVLSGGCEDDVTGLCEPSQVREVSSCEDASFTWDLEGKVYTDLDSVPVIILDSLDGFKDDRSLSDDGDPVIVSIGKNELKHSDLETLQDGEWLNDCVINAYFHLLSEKSPLNVFTHSSFFFFSLYKRGYEGVQRWTKNVDLFAQDLFFVPIHNKSHWTLVVVHIKEGIMEYYNSSQVLDGYPRSMTHIQRYLQEEAVHRGKEAFTNVCWEMYKIEQIPRQQNMDDCGLYICQYAKKLSLKQKVAFDSKKTSNLRQKMLRELLSGDIEVP